MNNQKGIYFYNMITTQLKKSTVTPLTLFYRILRNTWRVISVLVLIGWNQDIYTNKVCPVHRNWYGVYPKGGKYNKTTSEQ